MDNSMPQIKNLIFDMGGVILPMNPIEEPIRRFVSLGMTEEQCREYFGLYGQQGIFRQVEAGTLGAYEFLEKFRQLTGNEDVKFEDITWAWRGFVQDPPAERLANLDRLREQFHCVMLSNTNPFLMAYCCSTEFGHEGRPIQDYFHKTFMSYEMGGCKPDHKIYRMMLKRGRMLAEECLFLDDGPNNVLAARNVGLNAIQVPDNEDWMPLITNLLKT